MKHIVAKYLLMLICFLCAHLALGQDVFHTKAAQINIKVRHHGHVSNFWSDQLDILLDYNDASFMANLEKGNIHTDDKLLLDELDNLNDDIFVLSGKFGLENIVTSTHNPLQFDFIGALHFKGNNLPVSGFGRLEHIDGGYVACLLSFKFILEREILPQELLNRHSVEDISVEVLQSVIRTAAVNDNY